MGLSVLLNGYASKCKNSISLFYIARHGWVASEPFKKWYLFLFDGGKHLHFTGAGLASANDEACFLGLGIERMQEMTRVSHEGNEGYRFTLQDDLSLHAVFGHIKGIEQHMYKTEWIVAKGKKYNFLHQVVAR